MKEAPSLQTSLLRELPRPSPAGEGKAQGKCSAGRAPAGELPFLGEVNRKIAAGRQEKRFARQRNRSAAVGFRLLTSRANARLSAVHQSSGVFLSGRARPQMSNMPPAPKEFPRRRFRNRVHPLPQNFLRPQGKFPGAGPPGGGFCNTVCEKRGACAGEGLAGGPEGPASPKGFTGWDEPGAACGSPLADFSSGE